MLRFVLIALISTCVAAAEEQSRVVHMEQGPVKGYKDPNGDFYAFYAIPYATAPTGLQKFKGPLPPPTWNDTFEAIEKNIICPQSKAIFQALQSDTKYNIKEDCLTINVFVPNTKRTNLPVVVYIHGGGFQGGFGNMMFHRPLIESGKMIVVNFNYRLGAHGFLCLGTEDIPGNAGMKDQVAALRWVKNNIASFGGNPDDVTAAGYNAGAAAVELLLVSKSARGLFNKIIPESGAGVGVWSVQSNPLDLARSYASLQGLKHTEDIYILEKFLKVLPLHKLQEYPFINLRDSTFKFSACIEREGTNDPFLIDAPVNIIKNGDYVKLPVLTGFSDMEGIARLDALEEWKKHMNEKFSDFLPADLQFTDESEREDVAQRIKNFYFGDRPVDGDTAVSYVNYFSDVMFVYPTHRSLSLQMEAGSESLYLYMYAFVEDGSSAPYPGVTGANHGAQVMALTDLMQNTNNKVKISKKYKKIRKLMTDVWKNFIITGQPTPKDSLARKVFRGEWLPTSPAHPHHALFNRTCELRGALLSERMKLWDDIYSKYYRTPTPPPEPPKQIKSEL